MAVIVSSCLAMTASAQPALVLELELELVKAQRERSVFPARTDGEALLREWVLAQRTAG